MLEGRFKVTPTERQIHGIITFHSQSHLKRMDMDMHAVNSLALLDVSSI